MKYWTLFTLRLMVRVGVLASVCIWLACQIRPNGITFSVGAYYIHLAANSSVVYGAWVHTAALQGNLPDEGVSKVQFPGFAAWDAGPAERALSIQHWLLCLVFLIATILTGVRWRRRRHEQAE